MADCFKVYKCEECGHILLLMQDGSEAPMSCGKTMKLLEAGTVDAAREKHVPAVKREGGCVDVQVGEVLHPMEEAHYITFVAAVCEGQVQIKYLKPGQEPKAHFCFNSEAPITVYEYCNLHGLWKAEV